jgi:hypothetical protein
MIGGFPLWAWGEKLMQKGQDYGILLRAEFKNLAPLSTRAFSVYLPAVFISPPQCFIFNSQQSGTTTEVNLATSTH